MWKNINQIISGKARCSKTTTINTVNNDHGQIIHDEKLITNQFNKYFTEIGPKLSSQLQNITPDFSHYLTAVDCEYHFTTTTEEKVLKKLMKIKPNKASGLDKIPGKLLKDSAAIVAPFLNPIYLYLKVFFQTIGRMREYHRYTNQVTVTNVVIIDQYRSCLIYQKYWKKLCLNTLMTTLLQIK